MVCSNTCLHTFVVSACCSSTYWKFVCKEIRYGNDLWNVNVVQPQMNADFVSTLKDIDIDMKHRDAELNIDNCTFSFILYWEERVYVICLNSHLKIYFMLSCASFGMISHLLATCFILQREALSVSSHLLHHSVFMLSVSLFVLSLHLPLVLCRGWQGLIAQGCHSSILVIDPNTAQTIQVLERHKTNVVKVSFLT